MDREFGNSALGERYLRWVGVVFLSVSTLPQFSRGEAPESFVAAHCLECHDEDVQKGGLNFDALLDQEMSAQAETWERILRQVDARQMPPLGKSRPAESEYRKASSEMTTRLDAIAATDPNPGRTDTIRRITRTEYGNAIRDLLALDIDVSELLPADESSHGFDNVTVGELSPALLDRYLSAAQKIARLAVGNSLQQPDSRTVRIRPDITQEGHVEGLPLGTRGGALISHWFPRDGEYEIQVFLTRDRNEMIEGLTRGHDLEFLVDGNPAASLKVNPPRNRKDHTNADKNLRARIVVKAGPRQLGVTFVEDHNSIGETLRQPYESRFNFHRHPRTTPALFQVTITGPYDDSGPGTTPSRKEILRFIPGDGKSPVQAAEKNLSGLLRAGWRRPITDSDVKRILPFFEQSFEESNHFEKAMEEALAAILVSREFLFRVESDPEGIAPATPYELSDLELASRLSFFLWSSIPDEKLLKAAESRELGRPGVLKQSALRMLSDSRADSLATNFADQWLYLRNLESFTPDGRLFPDFDHNLRVALRRETEELFSSVVQENRSVLELIRPGETWLNERLAKHYGIPHVYGSRLRRVSLPPEGKRGGLLRNGSILTVTSYATRTSPVIRGNWILENLLGTPPSPPPPNTPALEDNAVSADLPVRERLAVHREKAACAGCHNLMDPVGFALENFDAIGRWREFEKGHPVDASGGLPGGGDLIGVSGLEEGMLERPEQFARTLTEKLMTYALGRGIEPSDAPAVRNVVRAAAEDDYRFSAIVTGIVTSEPFVRRMSAALTEPAEKK